MRTYTELIKLPSIEERFDYLALNSKIGIATFGFDRWMNQQFYHSAEWRNIRNYVITRDLGHDLGVEDFPISGSHLIHHMNPITMDDIEFATDNLFDPEFLITCALRTHNAVHYGDKSQLPRPFVPRSPGDTKPW